MITVSPEILYLVLLAAIVFSLLLAGVLWLLRQTNKDVRDGTPPDVVQGILGIADVLAKIALAPAAVSSGLTDDKLLLQYLEARGYIITGSPETGYVVTPPPPPEA